MNYQYDALNRLTQASTSTWGDTYGYDGWGNLLSKTPLAGLTGESLSVTMNASNQIVPPQGSLLAYDKAGEMTVDNAGNVYTYDAEGRVAQANDDGQVTTYTYDGNRKARVSGGSIPAGHIPSCNQGIPANPTELFITDPAGHEVTELTVANGWQWARTNIYGAGGLIATGDVHGLHFHLSDWLGSRRVQVAGGTGQAAAVGSPELACSNSPWGTQLTCTGPGTDSTEHHFTSKEYDPESSNDYFGARYYASIAGRWLSPDWASCEVSIGCPFDLTARSWFCDESAQQERPNGLPPECPTYGS